MPNSLSRWRTYRSSSTNEPGSQRREARSRASSFPASRWRSTAFSPPACSASSRSRARRSSFAPVVSSSVAATRGSLVHASPMGSPPLDRSTIWRYEDGEPGELYYRRYAHPNGEAAEAALGALEGGRALLFPSGAGASTALVLGLLEPGNTIAVAEGAYYGT